MRSSGSSPTGTRAKVSAPDSQPEVMVGQRTQIINGLRGHLAEIGIIAARGARHSRALAEVVHTGNTSIPQEVRVARLPLAIQLDHLDVQIAVADAAIIQLTKNDPVSSQLMSTGMAEKDIDALIAAGVIAATDAPH